jgi:hypothetical protein
MLKTYRNWVNLLGFLTKEEMAFGAAQALFPHCILVTGHCTGMFHAVLFAFWTDRTVIEARDQKANLLLKSVAFIPVQALCEQTPKQEHHL